MRAAAVLVLMVDAVLAGFVLAGVVPANGLWLLGVMALVFPAWVGVSGRADR